MAHHHKVDCLVKRLDCCAVVKVKVTEKVQNSTECSSWQYLFTCWTFCNQTWYGDASPWARQSCKKIGLLSSRSRSQWGLIKPKQHFLPFLLNCWSFSNQICSLECLVYKLDCCVQRQGHSEGLKLHWIFMNLIFSVLLATKLNVAMDTWCPNLATTLSVLVYCY